MRSPRIPVMVATFGILALVASCRPNRGLEGSWRATFWLDSASTFRPAPSARVATGVVWLSGNEVGRSAVDLRSILSFNQPGEVSWRPWGTDSVNLRLGAGGSDDGTLELGGRVISPDSIAGRWTESRYCCGAFGRFVLSRR